MKEKMKTVLEKMQLYNADNMALLTFGLDKTEIYDLLIVAPSYTPYKFGMEESSRVTTLTEHSYISSYLVEKDGMKIAWVKFGSSDSNLIDHVAICAELQFKKMIFVGAVGGLKAGFVLGDVCTPSYSVAGGYAHTYLKGSIKDFSPFEKVYPDADFVDRVIGIAASERIEVKKASVFCTASIAFEYYHLEEIRSFGTDLIEMETASFYRMAELLEVPSVALLIVSDNSATQTALVGRTEEQDRQYRAGFSKLSELLFAIGKN